MIENMRQHITRNEDLIFERSSPGKNGYQLPELDVPEVDAEALLRENTREDLGNMPEVSEIEIIRHFTRMSTWNYAVVHAYGTAEAITDPASVNDVLDRLTRTYEAGREPSWRLAAQPARRDLVRGLVGVDRHGDVVLLQKQAEMQTRDAGSHDGDAGHPLPPSERCGTADRHAQPGDLGATRRPLTWTSLAGKEL